MKCKRGKTDHPGMTATSIYRVGINDHMIDKCEPLEYMDLTAEQMISLDTKSTDQ